MPNKNYQIQKASTGTPFVYFQCGHVYTFRFTPYSAPEERRCGGDASYTLFFEGELTGQRHTKHLCDEHAQPYLDDPRVEKLP